MVSFSVIIYVDGHVSCHLSSIEVAHPEHSALYLLAPFWCPPFFQFWVEELVLEVCGVWFCEAYRIDAWVHSARAYKLEWTEGSVANCNRIACGSIASAFQFQMHPHHEFLGFLIVENLRALDDATALDVAARFFGNRKYESVIGPVFEVFGGKTAYA